MKIAIHAGHNPDGMIACGAVGYIKESTCAREVVSYVRNMVRSCGICIDDVTVNNGSNQSGVLHALKEKIDNGGYDLSISVHLNSASDKTAHGSETYYYPGNADGRKYANMFADAISKVSGLNRGAKETKALYIIKSVKPTSILLELCFVSNREDSARFDAYEYAEAIADTICNIVGITYEPQYVPEPDGEKYRITTQYVPHDNAENALKKLETIVGKDIFIITK